MEAREQERGLTVTALCQAAGISRQAVYKARKARSKKALCEEAILHAVRRHRALHPRMGARKLLHLLTAEGLEVGRDRFFALLSREGLLVPRKRSFTPRTTDSRHRLALHKNLLREAPPAKAPGEQWAADLTYIRTDEGFCYAAFVMDVYSRRVVGFHAGESLEREGALSALKMALGTLEKGQAGPIHHSDRGSQYASNEYVGMLLARGCKVSMTEENHCYENAKAERLNGILKQEYGLGSTFKTRHEARAAVNEAVRLYNTQRPHLRLKMKTPEEMFQQAA